MSYYQGRKACRFGKNADSVTLHPARTTIIDHTDPPLIKRYKRMRSKMLGIWQKKIMLYRLM